MEHSEEGPLVGTLPQELSFLQLHQGLYWWMDYGSICGLVLRRTTSPPPKLELDATLVMSPNRAVRMTCCTISAALKIRSHQEWKCPPGRPRATWLRTVEKDLAPLHLGLHTAKQSAQNRVT